MDTALPRAGVVGSSALAQAAIGTIQLPLLVLDNDLRIVATSDFFHAASNLKRQDILGRAIFMLGDGQWNIPELRSLLDGVLARHAPIEVTEIERDIAGRGTMRFSARPLFYEPDADQMILLSIKDVTQERAAEKEMRDLLHQKDVLLQETQHRIGNSLQIIASILLLKARSVQSEETRLHLHDAHGRVMSIAAVQQQLQISHVGDWIELEPYLSRLCESLAASMIAETRRISLTVTAAGAVVSSSEAVSIGLIVTELVINALKHAFDENHADGKIAVAYDNCGTRWRLSVSDNGVGKPAVSGAIPKSGGLGASIVEALAHQLEAHVTVENDDRGYRTTITHGIFV